jgi:hypothetical protein
MGGTVVSARRAVLGIAGVIALAGSSMTAASLLQLGGDTAQPIAFPHDLHAGVNQIPCMYCHTSADRSVDAGIPSVQVCAGCHVLAAGTIPPAQATAAFRADSAEIQKLVAYWREQRPIPWVRIYDLPDHVHFPHMRHVNAGVQCQECHGPVQEMRVIEKFASLQMGWCIQCHEQREVRTDCFVCHY